MRLAVDVDCTYTIYIYQTGTAPVIPLTPWACKISQLRMQCMWSRQEAASRTLLASGLCLWMTVNGSEFN